MNKTILCLVVGVLCSAATARADVLKFDFGTEQSPLFQGFTRVSDKTILDASRVAEPGAFGWEKAGVQAFPRLRPNALAGDFVWSVAKQNFRVNLPNGKYKVWFLYGDSRYGSRIVIPIPKLNRIEVNGKEAVSDPLQGWKEFYSTKYYYRGANDDYHAGDDFYQKYVLPNFKEATAEFEVTENHALFGVQDIPLCAMIVYPANEAEQTEDDIVFLKKELRRHTLIREVRSENINPAPEYSASDRKRGYVLYTRHVSTPPLAHDNPLPEEIGKPATAWLSQGERESAAFTVLPLQDLKDVRVTCSDLAQKNSTAKIAASSIKVEFVRHLETVAGGGDVEYSYRVEPMLLQPFPTSYALMDKGVNRTIVLTVAAGASTPPGLYEGSVKIAPANAPAFSQPLRVRVLPITLPENPILAGRYHMNFDAYYQYYYASAFRDEDFLEYLWTQEKQNLQLMKEYGLNSVAFNDDARFDVLDNPPRLKPDGRTVRWMDQYRDMGMKAMPFYGFQALTTSFHLGLYPLADKQERFSPTWKSKYRQLIENIRDTGKERGWPEVLIYIEDELSNYGAQGTEEALKRVEVVKGIPGIRTLASVNGPFERPLIGKVDILMPNYAFDLSQSTLDEIKNSKTELWLYNTHDKRFTWGYFVHRVGAKGRFQWYGNGGAGYPYDEFDSNRAAVQYDAFMASPDGPVAFVRAIEMREGLDDLRYVTLLDNLVNNAKDKQAKAVAEGQKLLDQIKALDPDVRNYVVGEIDPKAAQFETGDKMWSAQECERFRWLVAQAIIGLQNGARA